MPVHIRNVNAEIHAQQAPAAPRGEAGAADENIQRLPDRALAERLRPIVMDILRRELEELRRRRG
jgi:hypothetical protein